MNVYLAWALTILYFIVYPIWFVVWYIVIAAVALAKLLYRPIAWLLQPVVYLGRFLLACFVAPFHFIAKFEVSDDPRYTRDQFIYLTSSV